MYVRRCEPKGTYGIQCKTESNGDDSALVCTCDSDNCNNVDECVYCAEPAPTSTSAPNPNPIMCQVCGDGTGICTDVNDNGQAKECPGETDVCLYSETCTFATFGTLVRFVNITKCIHYRYRRKNRYY